MENNVFEDITRSIITRGLQEEIENRIKSGNNRELLEKYAQKDYNKLYLNESVINSDLKGNNLKENLKKYFNKNKLFSESIGAHPDFKDINNRVEKHYITSVFVDIKGSTKLATIKGLSLEEVREIKDKILTAAITVFQVFDGHIHRLQGDAIFAYFGNKNKNKSDSIIDALNATTILQYVFKEHISKLFSEMGMPDIKIRTGIDFGDDDKVLWSKYGIKECTEITTTSIHTDLAAKLQHKAGSNKIMIGDNIREFLDLPEEFYSVKKISLNGEEKEEKYILEHKDYSYKMWEFNWEKYLEKFPQISPKVLLPMTKLIYNSEKDYEVKCFYKIEEKSDWERYERNSSAIPKKSKLKFSIEFKDLNLQSLSKTIIWEVNNRGKEAEIEGETIFETKTLVGRDFECEQATAYKGHHYMRVKIMSKDKRIIAEDYFGIYVRD